MKELYACGFNGQNNLSFSITTYKEPKDFHKFERILIASDITLKYTGWSAALFADGHLRLAGPGPFNKHDESTNTVESRQNMIRQLHEDVGAFVGDHRGILGLLTINGYIQNTAGYRPEQLTLYGDATIKVAIHHIACTGNEKVAVCGYEDHGCNGQLPISQESNPILLEFPTFQAVMDWKAQASALPYSRLPLPRDLAHQFKIAQLVSNNTTFTLLTTTGSIYSWGDPRHLSLGRIPTSSTLASSPHLVSYLGGIPIRKIASGGWITAALSHENDLYLWGGRPGEAQRVKHLPDDGEEVKLVDSDEFTDIADVAVGDGHVVVLCKDGRLFTAGRGHNGQLGLGIREFEEEWVEVGLDLEEGKVITEVHCGAWSSFLVVEDKMKERCNDGNKN